MRRCERRAQAELGPAFRGSSSASLSISRAPDHPRAKGSPAIPFPPARGSEPPPALPWPPSAPGLLLGTRRWIFFSLNPKIRGVWGQLDAGTRGCVSPQPLPGRGRCRGCGSASPAFSELRAAGAAWAAAPVPLCGDMRSLLPRRGCGGDRCEGPDCLHGDAERGRDSLSARQDEG